METKEPKPSPATTPFKCHVFVCVNDRGGTRKSCADGNSKEIAARLKEAAKARNFPPGEVRISQSLCLGLCEFGPNVVLYPQRIWFQAVTMDDVDRILDTVEQAIKEPA
ncbi:MAG: (2Fe-2S) ferredoxin domain-containing protein [Solirubrobacterales bacterium]